MPPCLSAVTQLDCTGSTRIYSYMLPFTDQPQTSSMLVIYCPLLSGKLTAVMLPKKTIIATSHVNHCRTFPYRAFLHWSSWNLFVCSRLFWALWVSRGKTRKRWLHRVSAASHHRPFIPLHPRTHRAVCSGIQDAWLRISAGRRLTKEIHPSRGEGTGGLASWSGSSVFFIGTSAFPCGQVYLLTGQSKTHIKRACSDKQTLKPVLFVSFLLVFCKAHL